MNALQLGHVPIDLWLVLLSRRKPVPAREGRPRRLRDFGNLSEAHPFLFLFLVSNEVEPCRSFTNLLL